MWIKTGIRRTGAVLLAGSLALAPVAGCEDLPGGEAEQGAVIGGVGGAAAGAAVGGEGNRLVGALLGGVLGAGGGYLIGSEMEKADADDEDREEAREAVQEAQTDPATVQDVQQADTADLNDDGFVTLDEVLAMERAGLTDQEMINRLEATDQIFELSPDQEQYLADRGVSQRVIDQMQRINLEQREQILADTERGGEVIGQPQ
ncbi:MAG: glycine zipper domain-containing protein [Phycisphaeraceae bacterium]